MPARHQFSILMPLTYSAFHELVKNMNPKPALTKHLDSVQESYLEHLVHASGYAVKLALACIACAIHAVFPFAFEKTGSKMINALHCQMNERFSNSD